MDRRVVGSVVAAVAVAMLSGCREPPLPIDAGRGDLRSAGDGTAPGIDGSTPDLAVACPDVFPEFDKLCEATVDCFVARHMINCCGTFVAIGYHRDSRPAFDAAEATCEMMYPGCGCASQPTKAEDGRTELDGMIDVRCRMGTCTTYVP